MIDFYAEALIASPWMNRRVAALDSASGRAAASLDLAVGFVDARYDYIAQHDGNVNDEALWVIDRYADAIIRAPSAMEGLLASRGTANVASLVMDQAVEMQRARERWVDVSEAQEPTSTAVKRVAVIPADAIEFEQAVWDYGGVQTFYASYGVDDNWEVTKKERDLNQTTGAEQTGVKPETTAEFDGLTYHDAV